MPPALGAAVRLALRALSRERWLVAVALAVQLAMRLAAVPALAFTGAMVVRGAGVALAARPTDPLAPIAGALAAVTSPRFAVVALGLWLAGALAAAALRLVLVAGAAPVLAAAMAGAPGGAEAFAPGAAFGFPRVLGTALLGLAADAAAGGFALALALGAARITAAGGSPALAAPVALALTLAVAVPVAISAAVDAAVARAAVAGDGPLAAFAAATRRFVNRPGAFILGTIAFALAGGIAQLALEGTGNVFLGVAPGAPAVLLAGPWLMLGLAALAVSGAVELAWLGTVSALVCAEDR